MARPLWKRILRIGFFISIPFILVGLYIAYLLGKEAYQHFERKKYAETVVDTASPTVFTDSVYIDYLDTFRSVFIYLPPDYQSDTLRYPVVYFFDGDALFNDKELLGPEWQVDNVMDSLHEIGGQTAIAIGIMNSSRRTPEYMPLEPPKYTEIKHISGAQHAEWVATDLKAWVDSSFRTLPDARHTCIGGASLGGLMAYYCTMAYPEIYGSAIVLSPSFWVNDSIFQMHTSINNLSEKRIYINVGEEEEGVMIPDSRKMYQTLLASGMPPKNVRFDIVEDQDHWHLTWRAGVKAAYPWVMER